MELPTVAGHNGRLERMRNRSPEVVEPERTSPWQRRIVFVVVIVAVAACVAGAEQSIPQTPGSVALIAACGGALAALTLVARAYLAPWLGAPLLAVPMVLATLSGYGAGAQWWNNEFTQTWPFFAWGLILGPLAMAVAGLLRAVYTRLADR